jgi:alkylmercury lyase
VEDLDPTSGLLDRLGGDAAVVRRGGFALLYTDGRPVRVAHLAAACGMSESRVETALVALVGSGAATRDAHGALVATAGLSVVTAGHRLRLAGRDYFTWCAFDAIGIPAALGVDGVARTTCGQCGAPIEVATVAGQPPDGRDVVGWLPGGPCDDVQQDFCPAANLFCDAHHLTAWRAAAGAPPGRVATLTELAAEGRTVWAEMRPPSAAEHSG